LNEATLLDDFVLLARRLKAANPDAVHPGKAVNNPMGKARFPHGIFPAFYGPEASSFRKPQRGRRKLSVLPNKVLSPVGVQRSKTFGRGFGGGEPPMYPLLNKFQFLIHA
jgi:hypothetical protein